MTQLRAYTRTRHIHSNAYTHTHTAVTHTNAHCAYTHKRTHTQRAQTLNTRSRTSQPVPFISMLMRREDLLTTRAGTAITWAN